MTTKKFPYTKRALEIFGKTYDAIEEVIPFDKSWSGRTGFFDSATKNIGVRMELGQMAKSSTITGRRIIIIAVPIGYFLVYDRYNPSDKTKENYVTYSQPEEWNILPMFREDDLDDVEIELALGTETTPNIGARFKEFMQLFVEHNRNKQQATLA
jgi:hypothetical protein